MGILSPLPIPNKTCSTGPEDKWKGAGGRCKETLNFATGGFLSPETSCLPPKRSVNPGPTSLLTRFAEELRRASGPMRLTASGRGQVEAEKVISGLARSIFHLQPSHKVSRQGAPGMQSATNQRRNVVAINYFLEYPLFSFGL